MTTQRYQVLISVICKCFVIRRLSCVSSLNAITSDFIRERQRGITYTEEEKTL